MIKKAVVDYKNGLITLDQLDIFMKSHNVRYHIDSDGKVKVIIDVFRKTRKEKLKQLLNNP